MFCAFIAITIVVAAAIIMAITGGLRGPSANEGASHSPLPTGLSPTPAPGEYNPGNNGPGSPAATVFPGTNGIHASPTPTLTPGNSQNPGTNGTPVTPTPVSTPTPVPVFSATTSNWGSDKDAYPRGSTATGWVYVMNTGNVPIDQIDFTILVSKTIWFVPVEKTFTYNATGLNIQPGSNQQVAFCLSIPSDYQGISTAGDYRLTAKAYLIGNEIGSFSKNIKII